MPACLPIFWSYLRWSTPPQKFGRSEPRQLEPGKKWAAARGIQDIDDYRDPGVSAWSGKNLKGHSVVLSKTSTQKTPTNQCQGIISALNALIG
jgi:hypothetical protein